MNGMDTAGFRNALPRFLLTAGLITGIAVIIGEFLLMTVLATGAFMVAPSTKAILIDEPQGTPLATYLSIVIGPLTYQTMLQSSGTDI
jgi:hypothetical protein